MKRSYFHPRNLFLAGSLFLTSILSFSASAQTDKKVTICHYPPGNPENVQIITISTSALAAHQTHHGDVVFTVEMEVCPQPEGPAVTLNDFPIKNERVVLTVADNADNLKEEEHHH